MQKPIANSAYKVSMCSSMGQADSWLTALTSSMKSNAITDHRTEIMKDKQSSSGTDFGKKKV